VGIQIAALNPCQQTVGNLRAQVGPAASHRAQGVEQFGGRRLFENESARAAADGADDGVLVVVHRKDDDFHGGAVAQQLGGASMPFMPGRPISINAMCGWVFCTGSRRRAAFGLAHHAELGAALENALDAVAH